MASQRIGLMGQRSYFSMAIFFMASLLRAIGPNSARRARSASVYVVVAASSLPKQVSSMAATWVSAASPHSWAKGVMTTAAPTANSVTVTSITDDKCGTPTYVSGDTNVDNKIDLKETWTYTCSQVLQETTTNTVTVEVHNFWPGNADLRFDLGLRPAN